jgi:hypothetical protein
MSRDAPNTLSRRWRVLSAYVLFTACFGGCRSAVAHHLDAHLMPPTRTSFLHGCKHGANRRTWREGRADVISFRRNDQHAAGGRCPKVAAFRNVGSAEASGERTRPRVQFPASRRKTLFGETPNTTRGTRMLPRPSQKPWPLSAHVITDVLTPAYHLERTSHLAETLA